MQKLKFFLSASNCAPSEAIKTLKLCKLGPYIGYLAISASSKLGNCDPSDIYIYIYFSFHLYSKSDEYE